VQPFDEVPTTVYVVLFVVLTVTEFPVVVFKPLDGLQVYIFAPAKLIFVLCPEQ
jgi:hypothetical protein